MQVVNASTAAQYIHVLRRQLRRPFRKPLVVISPNKLLRFKEATSNIEEFGEHLRFKRIIANTNPTTVSDDKIRKVIFCSGQVYYDLDAARKKENRNDIAICRLEQFCPFPFR